MPVQALYVCAKLALLAMAFPNLRVVWSTDARFTVDLFVALKKGQPDVDAAAAHAAGGGGAGDELGSDNQGAEEMLQRLPGITAHNYRRVMRGVSCLADLCTMDEAQLVQLLGNSTDAKRLYRFLNQPAPV